MPIIVKEDLTLVKKVYLKTLNGEKQNYQVRIKTKNKNIIILRVNTAPIIKSNRVKGSISFAQNITKQIKAEKEIARFQKDILELTMHIEDMREKERKKIALDLHDDLGQKLTALNIDLAWLKEQIPKDNPRFSEKIKSMGNLLKDTSETVRRIASDLRPSILDNLGLIAAIKWQTNEFEKTTGINCRVELISEEIKIDPDLSINIFRMIQEALTNVTKHAHASKVIIKMRGKKTLKIEIIDNGIGINMKTVSNSRSFGLLGISERAKSCGGYMEISGKKGIGTELIINVPFTKMRKAND